MYPIRIAFPLEVYLIEDEGGSTIGFEVVFKLQICLFVNKEIDFSSFVMDSQLPHASSKY